MIDFHFTIEIVIGIALFCAGSYHLNIVKNKFREDPIYCASLMFLSKTGYWAIVLIVMSWAALASSIAIMAYYEDVEAYLHTCVITGAFFATAFWLSARVLSAQPQEREPVRIGAMPEGRK